MKLLALFVLLVLTRRYLSSISGAFDVIKFSNYYVEGKKGFFKDTLKWGNTQTDDSQSSTWGGVVKVPW